MTTPETYTRHRASADRLIARYGGGAVLVRSVTTGGGPSDPSGGSTTETEYPVTYIETGYQVGLQDGTAIQAGDVLGVMAVPAGIVPKPIDKLKIGGVVHTLMDLRPVQPSPDAPVLQFAFQARR